MGSDLAPRLPVTPTFLQLTTDKRKPCPLKTPRLPCPKSPRLRLRSAAAQPQTVTIPLEQLQAFTAVQARLAQMESDQRGRDDAARAEQVKLLAQKGEIENALRIQREEAQKQLDSERASRSVVEERAKRYALDGEVSRVLASQPLVPGGAEQLTQLWRSQFVVEPQGDSFNVRTPTFQSVGDFVAAQLARPEYAHFVRASNPGGGTAGATAHTRPRRHRLRTRPHRFSPRTLARRSSFRCRSFRRLSPPIHG